MPDRSRLNDAHTQKIGRPADPIVGAAYIGPVKFRPDGVGVVQGVFVQWIDGKQELVWPKEFASAPLAYPALPFAKR